ncbi:hypothetical protein IRJ41_025992 [Triplophysa rosa]|uniref:Uncharacterized protein n=1 Tax=Triplophysa rosa TaxID=992332 RepID=A0A9W8C5W5_TRIRA|nr:hypothetical protein IRJ41_025992 [Triplophysa rosa]
MADKLEKQSVRPLKSAGKSMGRICKPLTVPRTLFEVIMKTVQIKGFDNSECPPKLSPCNRTEPSVQHSSHPSSTRQNATPHSHIHRLSGDRKWLESKYGIRVFNLNSTNITEEISITFTVPSLPLVYGATQRLSQTNRLVQSSLDHFQNPRVPSGPVSEEQPTNGPFSVDSRWGGPASHSEELLVSPDTEIESAFICHPSVDYNEPSCALNHEITHTYRKEMSDSLVTENCRLY